MVAPSQLLVALLHTVFIQLIRGQCDSRQIGGKLKCCPEKDKDSYCFVNKRNRYSQETREICYCDKSCHYTGDCCDDAKESQKACETPRNCTVSTWTGWSRCSAACGFGVRRRRRNVLQMPSSGGAPCPSMVQVRGCNKGLSCRKKLQKKYQTAFILPVQFRRPKPGSWLYERILPAVQTSNSLQYNDHPKHQNTKLTPTYSYCVNFKVTFKQDGCSKEMALDSMLPVCVECQSRVMDGGHCRGEGANGIRTRWKALREDRCYGDWIRLGPVVPNCTCSEKHFSNFVFV